MGQDNPGPDSGVFFLGLPSNTDPGRMVCHQVWGAEGTGPLYGLVFPLYFLDPYCGSDQLHFSDGYPYYSWNWVCKYDYIL